MPGAGPLPEVAAPVAAAGARRPRRFSLRAIGMLGIAALIALATLMVASVWLFRDAVHSHLEELQQTNARHGQLLQERQDTLARGDEGAAALEVLDAQLQQAAAESEGQLATTRHYIDGSTVAVASLAWLGITSLGSVALLFFSRLAGDIAAVRARALAILLGDRSAGTPLTRRDELGELSQAVDVLAEALGRRERDLAVERRHVMDQEKLATIGAMAAGVIREMGNPVAAIDGYARRLLEVHEAGTASAPADSSDIRPILHEAQRLIAITREISHLAAAPASHWQLTSVNEIVSQALGLLRYEPRLADVRVTTLLDAQLPAVMGYADRLVQLLNNLVVNAADATAALPPRTAQIAVITFQAEGGVNLQVEDNGCGMSPEGIARALESPFTSSPAGRGSGLGLPLCRSIVDAHGGRIALHPRVGGGMCARVWLPLDGPVN